MSHLSRALTQRTELKPTKVKRSKDQFTKDEYELLIHGLDQFMFDNAYTIECRHECKVLKQKLNNLYKEMI